MTALPSGTTHSRYNKQKRKTNHFQIQADGSFKIWNNVWETYTGSTDKIESVTKESKPTELKKPADRGRREKRTTAKAETTKPEYDSLFPTFAEEVMDYIPAPVLRQLVQHYKNADVVEVEINVKTTHTIKG